MNNIAFEYVEDAQAFIVHAGADVPPESLGLIAHALARLADAYTLGSCDPGLERPLRARLTRVRLALPAGTEVSRDGDVPEALAHPVVVVCVAGVPCAELGALAAFAALCVDVAHDLGAPLRASDFQLLCHTVPCDDPPHARFAGLLAMRLARPDLPDVQTCGVLAELLAGLVAQHRDLRPWIPLDRDRVVPLRAPGDHPGVPLALAPFIVASAAVNPSDVLEAAFDTARPLLRTLGIEPDSPFVAPARD